MEARTTRRSQQRRRLVGNISVKRTTFITLSLIPVGIILLLSIFLKERVLGEKSLPILGEVPAFEFTDTEFQTFNKKQLDGKVWVADFIFTTCAGPCPVMTENLAWIHRSYLLEKEVDLVTLTVNPAYDSPQVLKEYANKYKADTRSWHFLTGSKESILDLAYKGFKLGDEEDPIYHSPKIALIDKQGRIRGYYMGTEDDEIKRLFKDIAKLL